MAQTIKVKRSAVAGKAPTTSDLELGELGLNVFDGKLYAKKDDGTESIVELSGVSDSAVTNAKVASNAAISGTKISPNFGSQNVTTTGTATAAALIPSGSSVPTNGVYLPSANNVAISTSGSERIRIGANGQIGLSGANYGTSGQVLTSAGSGTAPTWTTPNNSSVEGGLTVGSTNEEDPGASVYFNVFPSQDPAIYIKSYAGSLAPVPMAFKTGLFTSEACRIDEGGRLLIGTSYASTNFYGNTCTPKIQLDDNVSQGGVASIVDRSNNIGGTLILGAGYYSPPSVDAEVGALSFQTEDDEYKFLETASIKSFIDGTAGIDDMPGRLVLSVTADGAASPTEALRITNDRVIAYNQPNVTSKSAAATLTIAELKTGIIQYTGAAATLTLPTGTLSEGGFSDIYTNMTFEWSVINTGSGTCTIGAGTDHTIVGRTTLAANTSGRFASRRTAANTFVTYRLS